MGSLNLNGQHISQLNRSVKNLGHQINITTFHSESVTNVSNAGEVNNDNLNLPDVHWNDLTTVEKNTDNSLDKQLFTHNGTTSGILEWEYIRAESNHVSVQTVRAQNIGASDDRTERKIFWLDSDRGKTSGYADWNIFNNSGEAVGAGAGTTDIDNTPYDI